MIYSMLAALAAIILGQTAPPDLSQRVTLISRAASVGQTVGQLAKLASVNLSVAPVAANDIVVVHAKDVPLRDLMDRIATVTESQWQQDGATLRLVPDVALRQREINRIRAGRITNWRQQIAVSLKALQDMAARPANRETDSSADLAGYAILRGLPPDLILAVEQSGRVVFSSVPTRMQRPLPPILVNLVRPIIDKHNRRAVAFASQPRREPEMMGNADEAQAAAMAMFMPNQKAREERERTPLVAIGKVLVVVQQSRGGFMQVGMSTSGSIDIYDPKGRLAVEHMVPLGGLDSFRMAENVPTAEAEAQSEVESEAIAIPPPPEKSNPATKSNPIQISPETQQWRRETSTPMANELSLNSPLSEALRQRILDPVSWDPLGYLPTDQMFSLAQARNLPLVAVIPDSQFKITESMDGGSGTVEDLEATINDGKTWIQVPDNGWLVLRLNDAEGNRKTMTPRAALRQFVNGAMAGADGSLAQFGRFAQALPVNASQDIAMFYLWNAAPGGIGISMMMGSDWERFRLYDGLGAGLRQSLRQGGNVPVGQLPPPARAVLSRMIYGTNSAVQVERGAPKPTMDDFFLEMMKFQMGGEDAADEPTEAFGDGLPANGQLSLAIDHDFYASIVPEKGTASPFFRALGTTEWALMDFVRQQPGAPSIPSFDRMRIGRRDNVRLTVRLSSMHVIRTMMVDDAPLGAAPIVRADALPAEVTARLQARHDALAKSPFAQFASGGMGRAPVERP